MRKAEVLRKTAETEVFIELNLDGGGKGDMQTGNGFFDHMLTLLALHSGFGMTVSCKGDTHVDFHHSCEDIGISLGQALKKALSDKAGICRYGHVILPMDETLVLCAADISGRAFLNFDAELPKRKIGDFDAELIEEFFAAFVRESGITLHIRLIYGKNLHHIAEGIFKAFARTLKACVRTEKGKEGSIPSTKGVL